MDFLDSVIDRLNSILTFFTDGIYQFFVDSFALLVEYLTLSSIKFMIWSVQFGWDVAESIIVDLGLTSALDSAWSNLGSDAVNALAFFNIPEGINMVLTAFITRYVMRFIPFTGR